MANEVASVVTRPRVVVVEPTAATRAALGSLSSAIEVIEAKTIEEAVDRLRAGEGDGLLTRGSDNIDPLVILESLRVGVSVVEQNGILIWHNQAFADLAREANGSEELSSDLRNRQLYDVLGCEDIEGPDFCPIIDCLGGSRFATGRLRTRLGKHLELTAQPLSGDAPRRVVCHIRDVTFEVRDRQKLIAIHRAGLELSHLTADELAQMCTSERIDLLKANILQYSQSILNFKNLEIRLIDPVTNRLNVLLSEGMTAGAHARELVPALDDNGVTGFVAYTGKSYLCPDVRHDPHYLPGAQDARSSLTVPVIYRERVIGTFNVESPQPHHFTESDREFLEIFAREIAVALNTLDLLQIEKQHGGSSSVEAILTEVSLPVDEIVADTIRMFDYLHSPVENKEPAHEAIRRVLLNARSVKTSIQKVARRYQPTLPALSPAESTLLAGRKILLADADPQVRRSAHSFLGRVGCDVDTARDGQEALRLARSIRYDVILGDIRLPDMNGYEFFSRMRDTSPGTPTVLITGFGYDANHSMVRARQEGLRVVLYKPFRFDRLCEAIADSLDPQVAQIRSHTAAGKQAIG